MKLIDHILYSKTTKIAILLVICLAIGFIAPAIINIFLDFAPPSPYIAGTCHIKVGMRANCFPEVDAKNQLAVPGCNPDAELHKYMDCLEEQCLKRGCCFQDLDLEEGAPICHRKIPSLIDVNVTNSNCKENLNCSLEVSYPEYSWPPTSDNSPEPELNLQIRRIDDGHLVIKMYNKSNFDGKNFIDNGEIGSDIEIQRENTTAELTSSNNQDDLRLMLKMWQTIDHANFPDLQEKRLLLDASYGSVILSEMYSEFSFLLPTYAVYGLSGHELSFNSTGYSASNFTKRLVYNMDSSIYSGYQHSNPGFIVMGTDKRFIGVHIDVGGAPIEIEAMPGASDGFKKPMLVFRTMRGSAFIIHLFLGPTPIDIMKQMLPITKLNETSVQKPPYWTLGHHVCRNTSDQESSFRLDIEKFMNITATPIPYDSDCIGQGLMKTAFGINNHTYDNEENVFDSLKEDFDILNSKKKKFMLRQPVQVGVNMISPEDDNFIKSEVNSTINFEANFTNVFTNKMSHISLIDFEKNSTREWFEQKFVKLIEELIDQNNMPDNESFSLTLIKNSPLVYNNALMDDIWDYGNATFCNTSAANIGPFVPKIEWKLENNNTTHRYIDEMGGPCSWTISGTDVPIPNCALEYLDPASRYNSSDVIGAQGTMCPTSLHLTDENQVSKQHIVSHNSYSLQHLQTTSYSVNRITRLGKTLIFSEHSYTSAGAYGGVLGSRFESSWQGIKDSLREVLELGLTGIPIVSMMACGDRTNEKITIPDEKMTEDEKRTYFEDLCLRWYQLAAYMPALHSEYGHGKYNKIVTKNPNHKWIKRGLDRRMMLMPYLYTYTNMAYQTGIPPIAPLFLHFPEDELLNFVHMNDKQFMFGPNILVTPVLNENEHVTNAYIPQIFGGDVGWYDLWSGAKEQKTGVTELETTTYQIFAHVKAGSIVPMLHDSELSIMESFEVHNYTLIVAPSCLIPDIRPRWYEMNSDSEKKNCTASGIMLNLENKEELNKSPSPFVTFELSMKKNVEGKLLIKYMVNDIDQCPDAPDFNQKTFNSIAIYGFGSVPPTHIYINQGAEIDRTKWTFDEDSHRLDISNINFNICDSINWKFE